MYIAQVLQDPNSEEAGSGSGEDDGQGSSQDEEIINVENGLTEDFQSGEDSLIENEVRHWYCPEQEEKSYLRSALNMWIKPGTEQAVLQSISTSTEGLYTNKSTLSTKIKWTVAQGPFTGSHQTMCSVCVPTEDIYPDNAGVAASTCHDLAEAHPKTLHMDKTKTLNEEYFCLVLLGRW